MLSGTPIPGTGQQVVYQPWHLPIGQGSLKRVWSKLASSDPGGVQATGIEWGRAVMSSKGWEAPPLLLLCRGH